MQRCVAVMLLADRITEVMIKKHTFPKSGAHRCPELQNKLARVNVRRTT